MNASGISQRLIAFASSHLRLDPRRAGARVDRRVAVLRGDLRLRRRRRRGARVDHDPRHEGEGLPGPSRRFGDVVGRDAGGDHPAVDPDDPLRRDGGDLGGPAVRRGHRAGPHRRIRTDGHGVLLRAPLQPAARGALLVGARGEDRARGAVGLPAADHHPGRHLRRRGDGDRRRGAGGRGRPLRRPRDLPRTEPQGTAQGDARGRHPDGGRDAAGRHEFAARHLPDRSAGAAGAGARGFRLHEEPATSC